MATDDQREQIFSAAAEIDDPEQRAAYLHAVCGSDADLRAEIEELLRHDAEAGSFLAGQTAAEVPSTACDLPPGTQIGPYTLVEKIGAGGFGLVYIARQSEPVRREVALKVIKPGMDSREVLARFAGERQALALMDHPNIARVLDGGATDAGRPYFVMELVRGQPITDYCDRQQLTPKQRLELFATVCHAVQHAHQKGIIHRDLKPSNVIVTTHDGKPMAKVIDFGVAKAIGQKLNGESALTQVAQMIGTPLYMSPEQAEMGGHDIDTRSDIYSLGVLLYELLTGSTPFDKQRFANAALDEIRRVIREEEPQKPSTRLSLSGESLPSVAALRKTEPAKLSRLFRGDLDWITMKALEKDRNRRYDTANGLAIDVLRYLADEPVSAGPPSASYRLSKFVKRNRGPVLAAASGLALLIAGIVGTTWGMVTANTARKAETERANGERIANAQAQKRFAQVEKGSEILASVFTELDIQKVKEGSEPLEAVLAQGLVKAGEQLEGEAVGDPLVVASLQNRLGLSLLHLGMPDRAIPLLVKARTSRAASLGADHPDTLASMHNLGSSYRDAGKLDQALPLLDDTLKRRNAKLGADHPDTLTSMNNLARGYRAAGQHNQALLLFEETFKLMKVRLGAHHQDTLSAMSNVALAYQKVGRLDQALPRHEETVKLKKDHLGVDHPETLISMNNLANCYQAAGKLDQALPLYVETLRLKKAKLGAVHPSTITGMASLAAGYRAAGKLDLALPLLEESLQLRKAKLGADHPSTLISMGDLAACYRDARQLDKALPLLEETLKLTKAKLGADHPDTLGSMTNLARGYRAAGRLDQAVLLQEEVFKLTKTKLGADDPATLISMHNVAYSLQAAGKLEQALPLYTEAAAGFEKRRFQHQYAAWIVNSLIDCHEKLNQYVQAEEWRRKLLLTVKERVGIDALPYASELSSLGQNLLHQKKWTEAEVLLRECLSLREKKAADVWSTFHTKSLLGAALLGQKKYAEAEPLLLAGFEGMRQREKTIPPQESTRIPEAIERLVQLYEAMDNKDEAGKWKAKLPKADNPMPKP